VSELHTTSAPAASTAPSPRAVELAARARTAGLVGLLRASDHDVTGMARPELLRVEGPDAASFLHSQLTNEVNKLDGGEGNTQARVTRTGHLEGWFTLHRLPRRDEPHPAYLLLTEAGAADALHASLDAFLFSDRLTLEVQRGWQWIAAQGPAAEAVLSAVFGALGFEPWSTLREGSIRPLLRARSTVGVSLPEGAFAVRRSLTGDVGFLLGLPGDEAMLEPLGEALRAAAAPLGVEVVDGASFSEALEVLRIEAGFARVGPDTSKRRLLPETGLEHSAVSYSKGCYIGQEVIARVRTYGSVPNLLRALLLPASPTYDDRARALLATLPEVGAELIDSSGAKLGHIASRTWSPVKQAGVAFAYLGRQHRTPGTVLQIQSPAGPCEVTVAALPLYSAPDAAARVGQLYDLAVRRFADGDADAALSLLEDALRLDAGFADGYEAIGVMLGRAGRFNEAIDFFRRLEEVAPDEPLVNTNLSLYYMKLGDKQTAEDEAGKATLKSMNRHRGAVDADVEADLERSRKRDALRKRDMFRRVLEIDDADPIALFGLGAALYTLGEPDEAAGFLQRAIEVDRNNSAVYALHGKALERLERLDDAVAVYRSGIEVASRKGDLMPLKEMEHRLLLLGASKRAAPGVG
jgi:folate-binding protein YgfZ